MRRCVVSSNWIWHRMQKIELNIIALANSESSEGNFALILEEHDGLRRLPIIIGPFEAQAIAVALEKMQPNRPLTHDLFRNALKQLEVHIKEVVIHTLRDGVFHASIHGTTSNDTSISLDARPSDAIALAVRVHCSIYTTPEIMDRASVTLGSTSKSFTSKRGNLDEYTLAELKDILQQVLAKEDYETASKIRDAIKRKEET